MKRSDLREALSHLGRLGGRRRAQALSPARRSEIARRGALARHRRKGYPLLPEAVSTSLEILRVQDSMVGRVRYGHDRMEETVTRVVATFDRVGAKWALVGAHVVGMLTEPRATTDFDFVVEEPKLHEILDALRKEFPELAPFDMGPAVRLTPFQIDLIKSTQHPIFREALKGRHQLDGWPIPSTEAMVALKFWSAISGWRATSKKLQDASDMVAIYQAHKGKIDRELLVRLAALAYPGAEREFTSLLGKIDRGDPITI
ncbi:MAG: hypothetical protein HYY93_04700 [Planctomycetes bacterium]|nr:hypothetical protein [Planctomycetota bacterium]